jgi:hypothetical protein
MHFPVTHFVPWLRLGSSKCLSDGFTGSKSTVEWLSAVLCFCILRSGFGRIAPQCRLTNNYVHYT